MKADGWLASMLWDLQTSSGRYAKVKTGHRMTERVLSVLGLEEHCWLYSYLWTMRQGEPGSQSSCSITPWLLSFFTMSPLVWGTPLSLSLMTCAIMLGKVETAEEQLSNQISHSRPQNSTKKFSLRWHLPPMSWYPINMLTKRLQRVGCELSTAHGSSAHSCFLK